MNIVVEATFLVMMFLYQMFVIVQFDHIKDLFFGKDREIVHNLAAGSWISRDIQAFHNPLHLIEGILIPT